MVVVGTGVVVVVVGVVVVVVEDSVVSSAGEVCEVNGVVPVGGAPGTGDAQ